MTDKDRTKHIEHTAVQLDTGRNQSSFTEPTDLDGKCEGIVKVFQAGDECPTCHQGRLDYDGMLNLACPKCGAGVNSGGAFT